MAKNGKRKFEKGAMTAYLWPAGKSKIWKYRFFYYGWSGGLRRRKEVKHSAFTGDFEEACEVAWREFSKLSESESEGSPVANLRPVGRLSGPTVAEVIAAHAEFAGRIGLGWQTGQQYRSSLRTLVEAAHGEGAAERVRVMELGEETVRRFREAVYRAAGEDPRRGMQDPARNSYADNVYRQARSVFARAARAELRKRWQGFPDLEGFRKVAGLKVKVSTFFRVIPEETVLAIDAGIEGLWASDDRTHWMMAAAIECARFGGLSVKEIEALRWHWIRLASNVAILEMRNRDAIPSKGVPAFYTKWGTKEGEIPLALGRVQRWARWLGRSDCGLVIDPEGAKTARFNLINRRCNEWLGQYLSDRVKKMHELRKLAGSQVGDRHGIHAAAVFLRSSLQTVQRHYQHRNAKGIQAL